MVKKNKAKKFRHVSRTHGRGHKAGRGKGLRGGSGMSGMHKHRYATTVILQKKGIFLFGRHGFKRHVASASDAVDVINVRDLDELFSGQKTVDLEAAGYDKLLGGGTVAGSYKVKVSRASPSAVEKIAAAGGSVTTTAVDAAAAKPDGDE